MLTSITRQRHALALTGAAASWGLATVMAKHAVSEIPPTVLLPTQLTAGVLLLGPLSVLSRRSMSWSHELRRLGWLGVLNPGLSYALGLLGLAYITASLSVLLWTTEPVFIIALAWWLLGDRIDIRTAVAAVLALAGVGLVVVETSHGDPIGVLLTLVGVAACGVYTVVTRKWIGSEATIQVVAVQQLAALVFALVLAVSVAGVTGSGFPVASSGAWVSAAASGVLYYGVAFWLYLTGLRGVPAAIAGLFLTLIPVFGLGAGRLLLQEQLAPRQWLGVCVIVVALSAVSFRTARVEATRMSRGSQLGREVVGEGALDRPAAPPLE